MSIAPSGSPVRILLVEDDDERAARVAQAAQQGDVPVRLERVRTAGAYHAALGREPWDVIIGETTVAALPALEALQLMQDAGLDIPFIVVSSVDGEERAVEAMRRGACDYIRTHRLDRLAPAITRELQEAEARRGRREAERALRLRERELALVYDHVDEGLAMLERSADGQFRLLSSNARMAALGHTLGWTGMQPRRGATVDEIIAAIPGLGAATADAVRASISEAVLLRRPTRATVVAGGDRPLHAEQSTLPIVDERGVVTHVLLSFRDITAIWNAAAAQRRLEERLAHAEKLKALGTLAGGLAHDFNNLLTSILGYCQLAQDEVPADSTASTSIVQVRLAAQTAQELVTSVLAFARRRSPRREPVAVDGVVQDALDLLQPRLPDGVTLHTVLAPNAMVSGDGSQLLQVVMNLIMNALHALEGRDGRLELEVTALRGVAPVLRRGALPQADYVRLRVADTGVGIPEEILPRIFDPFFTTKGLGEGTGLGLAVVHGVVETHDGAVDVRSTPGEGTVIDVWLPAQRTAPTPGGALPRGQGELLLLVDPDPAAAQLMVRQLERLGYRAMAHSDPIAAVEHARALAEPIAAAIVRHALPGMGGAGIVRALRQIHSDIPALVTVLPDEQIDGGERDLFSGVLVRPTTLQQLAQTLAAAVPALTRGH